MALWPRIFSHAKAALICALSSLLLVAPACRAFCKAQSCEAPRATEKLSCHESAAAAANEHASTTFDSERSCSLQEMPVALPATFRNPSSDLLGSPNITGLASIAG